MESSEVFLKELNDRLRKGWTAHLNSDGRIYYMNHDTKMSSWLPPVECWEGSNGLPYGWESAIDKDGKIYYINHTSRTTTLDSPLRRRRCDHDEQEEKPREVSLVRDPQQGFGFVAGSEKPVIVRFVTDGGPNEKKLMPGDQILKINGEDVMRSPREHVIELIRSCKQTVNLLVCQPQTNNTTRKSALLTAAKKAKLKSNPSKVRFSEGVTINGSPLFSPVEGNAPFLPNVLKVFLENGQTKSFKYDATTTVQDVLNSLFEKLSIRCPRHFCLATEHVKITRKNRLTLLDPRDELAKIASRPGSHHLRCVLRVAFVPRDAQDLLKKDPVTFEYLYMQCCNDVVEERFMPELKYEMALRLTAVHMQQHCLSTGIAAAGKVTLKAVERECGGLGRFVPASLLDSMRGKELRKLLSHFVKACHKIATPLQAKLYFLRSVADMPSYGAKCFPTNITDSNPEMTVLVSQRFGISQISCSRGTMPVPLCRLEEVVRVEVEAEDEWSCLLHIHTQDRQPLTLSLEEKDAEEFVLMLCGYHRLLSGRELEVERHATSHLPKQDAVPSFHSRHMVHESPWSYPPPSSPPGLQSLDLTALPPPYTPPLQMAPPKSPKHAFLHRSATPPVDHNMNETRPHLPPPTPPASRRRSSVDERHPGMRRRDFSASVELMTEGEVVGGDVDVDVHEAKNEEVIRRMAEVEKMVAEAGEYLHSAAAGGGERVNLKDDGDELEDLPSSPLLNQHFSQLLRRDSSFGLHSPDTFTLPLVEAGGGGGENILDILRDMREEEEQVVCLDPDLIDLTAIPPPATPEVEEAREMEAIDPPPGLFDGGGDTHESISLDSLESLLATLSPPANDVTSKEVDLSAYIIPPPPTSSPGSTEQVIARFLSAAEDIRCLILTPPTEDDSSSSGYASSLTSFQSDDSSFATPIGQKTTYQNESKSSNEDESFNFAPPTIPCSANLRLTPPIVPALKTSCVEDKVEEVLSPSSTISSDSSSVVLLQQRLEEEELEECRRKTGSCDDLLDGNRLHPLDGVGGMVRSVSWDGMAEEDPPSPTFHTSSFLRQNRLRRSFHRGSTNRPKCSTNDQKEETLPIPPTNGTTHKFLLPDQRNPAPNGLNSAHNHYEQALSDISAMVVHLRKVPRLPSSGASNGEERAKVCAARDVLANESRRFVTASKLFVRSAMEGAEQTATEGVAVCVALLNRMMAIGEVVASRVESRLLLEGLEAVALAHLRTVEAARQEAEGGKGKLMQCATQLATALTALMRTLRTI